MSRLKSLNKATTNIFLFALITANFTTFSQIKTALADSPDSITLPGTIRDFQGTHPNFGFGNIFGKDPDMYIKPHLSEVNGVWITNETGKNIVTNELGVDSKPVFNSANTVNTVTNADDFNEWYNDTPGVNRSKSFALNLFKNSDGMYHYSTDAFFPIDGEMYGSIVNDPALISVPNDDYWEAQGFKDRNYFFTYETHSRFVYQGNEVFTFSGDDDVWVYINGKRVIDLSGVHGEESETFVLDSDKAAELGLTLGQAYDFDFFFAERNYRGSNFTITTNIELNNAPNANDDKAITTIYGSVTIDVLANDTDADGDSKIISKVTPVTNGDNVGSMLINENNQLVYTAGNVPGEYTFTYTVEDEHGDSDVGNVVITVTAAAD